MKSSVYIPDSLMDELLATSSARSQAEAVREAVQAYVDQKHREKAAAALGTLDDFIGQEDLERMRGEG